MEPSHCAVILKGSGKSARRLNWRSLQSKSCASALLTCWSWHVWHSPTHSFSSPSRLLSLFSPQTWITAFILVLSVWSITVLRDFALEFRLSSFCICSHRDPELVLKKSLCVKPGHRNGEVLQVHYKTRGWKMFFVLVKAGQAVQGTV